MGPEGKGGRKCNARARAKPRRTMGILCQPTEKMFEGTRAARQQLPVLGGSSNREPRRRPEKSSQTMQTRQRPPLYPFLGSLVAFSASGVKPLATRFLSSAITL